MRILVVGLGSIVLKHIDALKLIVKDVEFFALRSGQNRAEVAGVRNIYSISELSVGFFDFIIISNPTSIHVETIEKLLFLNCPLFIEKPLSNNLEFGTIIDNINNKKLLTYIGCNLRFLGSLDFIAEHLQSNPAHRVHEINVYCGSYLPAWRPKMDFKTIYSSQKKLGGGVHIDLIHELDYVYWLFGSPNRVSKTFRNSSTLNIDAFDYANYCMEYTNFCVSIILNYYRRDNKRTMEIVFEDETWTVDLLHNNVQTSDGSIIYESNQTILDTYKTQMAYFVDLIIQNKNESINTINDAYNVLKICLENES